MRRLLRLTVALGLLGAAGLGFVGWRAWKVVHRPFNRSAGETFEIRPGSSAGEILRRLEAGGVLADADLARLYLVHVLHNPPLQAGEYRFDEELTIPEVLDRLVRGVVVTHPVTVVEGLTLEETAGSIARQGFGEEQTLLDLMRSPELVSDLDPQAPDLEGYLFPDTYHLPKSLREAEVVATMVRNFRRHLEGDVLPLLADDEDPPPVHDIVVLASIVEKEAGVDAERPVIAGVYANRLRRGIGLYADPTVIFALKRAGTWDGNLRRRDLALDSPYNTYRYPGLPPGPICSAGAASLRAAARPAAVPYLYFVSRNDGTHVFSSTLAEHNRNVAKWQKEYWRRRWAEERAAAKDGAG